MDDATYKQLLAWSRPRGLSALIALYESNYQRLLQLAPEQDFPYGSAVSRSLHDRDLHLRVLERSRYTVSLNLSYRFLEDGENCVEPDIDVRVYRDAGLAEAIRCGPHAHCAQFRDLDRELGPMLAGRWGRNLLLGKWLDYLLACGHGFSLAARPRQAGLRQEDSCDGGGGALKAGPMQPEPGS
jgi:uncharacterized protein YqiB (DUF1249 family)